MQVQDYTASFTDFLNDLKNEINSGRSKNDLKTIINQKIKSLNDVSEIERQTVSNNEQTENKFYCMSQDVDDYIKCKKQCELCKPC